MEQGIKQVSLHAQELLQLSKLEYDDIFLVRVLANDNNVQHLLSYIKITTVENDYTRGTPFHAGAYFTPYHKQAVTSDFKILLRNCKKKSLLIESNDDFSLTFFYKKAEFLIDN